MSRAIYKRNLFYSALRPYVDYCTRSVYSKIIIDGEENLPKDGAVILAPNHCNALMDALVILRAFPGPTVFGARADIFRSPAAACALRFLKILPMVRMRDGLHNVIRNRETTEEIVGVLENGVRFCMFNEGTHRTMRSLLPVGKGIFRIAVTAAERSGKGRPVYVVPVGLEYGDYFRYKSTLTMTYGKPINVTEALKEYDGTGEAELYRKLREMLAERLAGLITCIKDDGTYEAKWILAKVSSSGKQLDQQSLIAYNRATVSGLERLEETKPEKAAELYAEAVAFDKERLAGKVSYLSLGQENQKWRILFRTLTAIIGLPYFLWCSVMAFPMWATAEYLCRYRIKDRAFLNTARFGVKLAMSPIMIAVWAAWFFSTLPWQFATLLLLLNLASYSKFYEYTKFMRILISDFRLMGNSRLREKFSRLSSEIEDKVYGH